MRVELAGTEIVEAIGYAVPPKAAALYTLIVILAADVPLVFATTIELILYTLPLAAALEASDVAEVVDNATDKLPALIVVTLTMLGFAIFYLPLIVLCIIYTIYIINQKQ